MNIKKIILIGLMGAGKTKVAKILAKQLRIETIDTDNLIEKTENKSISQIFQERGEEYFRLLEHEILSELTSQPKPLIIATGGGLPCFNDNMNLILEMGQSFYLKASNEVLVRRLLESKNKRPLIKQMDENSLLNYLDDLILKREVFYSQANFIVDANKFSENLAQQIIKQLAAE